MAATLWGDEELPGWRRKVWGCCTTIPKGTGARACTTHLDLLIRGDSTEDDLSETLGGKHPEADPTNDTPILDQGQSLMLPGGTGDRSLALPVSHTPCFYRFPQSRRPEHHSSIQGIGEQEYAKVGER